MTDFQTLRRKLHEAQALELRLRAQRLQAAGPPDALKAAVCARLLAESSLAALRAEPAPSLPGSSRERRAVASGVCG